MTTTIPSYSEEIAQFVADFPVDDVPEPVKETARLHFLDGLGVALAATATDFGGVIYKAGKRLGRGSDASVIGYGTRLPATSAALVNGTLIHGLDFDDTHIGSIHHPTAPALATALGVGEATHASGEEVLAAYILGLELGCRFAGAVPGELHDRGFHATGVMGTFAAVGVPARLRAMSPEATAHAFGIAGSQAAGTIEIEGSWLKRMHPGWAAHSGIIAAAMGSAGFVGPRGVFEGRHGVYQVHVGRVPNRLELGIDTLGTRWMTGEIALKLYPCCHYTHAFVEAALDLRDEMTSRGLELQDIESIEAPTSERMFPIVAEPAEVKIAPKTIYDALFTEAKGRNVW